MAVEYPARVRTGVTAAALLSLWGAVAHFGFETEYQRQNPDPYKVALQTQRLEPLIAEVPPDATIGYVTDAEGVLASSMLNGTRYALAPRLVIEGADQPRVLGNFTRPADFAAFGAAKGLRIERDFGNGLVLYRREPAP